MDQLIPSLAALVESFRGVFRPSVFVTFQALLAGWIVCVGPHTISGVWQATGFAAQKKGVGSRKHCYRLPSPSLPPVRYPRP